MTDHEHPSEEFQYFLNNSFEEYAGEWIAIKGQEVIAHSESERDLREQVDDVDCLIHRVLDPNKAHIPTVWVR